MELKKLIEKYEKEWNKYGMGAVISYSELITDLKAVEKHTIKTAKNAPLVDVSGSVPLDKVNQLLKMQIEECRYFAQRCARDYGAASADYDKWIAETPIITLHRQ